MRLAALAVVLAACSGAQPQAPCAPVADIESQWQSEANTLIDSGACDEFSELAECPAWNVLNGAWAARQVAAESRCSPKEPR